VRFFPLFAPFSRLFAGPQEERGSADKRGENGAKRGRNPARRGEDLSSFRTDRGKRGEM
jgi:hypothetical protein